MTTAEPFLETGHEPATPAGDTIVRRFLLNLGASTVSPVAAIGGLTTETGSFTGADTGRPAALFNWATLLRPLATGSTDPVLDEIERFYAFSEGRRTGTRSISSASGLPPICDRVAGRSTATRR